MAKIPLEKTIGATYSFAFSNILSVFGVLWLPSLILVGLVGAIFFFVIPDFHFGAPPLGDDGDRVRHLIEGVAIYIRFAGLIMLVSLLMRAMVTVGVMEKALDRRDGPVLVYFSLRAPVWRLIGALILASIIITIVAVLTVCAVMAAIWTAVNYAPGIAGLAKVVSILGGVLFVIYVSFRLTFFLPAVVVAEETIGIGRAWQLSSGNFWRIVGLLLAVLLPVGIVARILGFALFGFGWLHAIGDAVNAHHMLSARDVLDIVARQVGPVWPAVLVYVLVYVTLVTGLAIGAIGTAYKAVTAESAV
ncbi:MAG: hypothetical protein JOZ72_03240 [Alphaproteobacteria bacterium]|nr:hypothetical protein [Alphaproteobacteria bacterium]